MKNKKAIDEPVLCPCGSGGNLEDCCLPYIKEYSAPTAEALMRSRYSAYVLGFNDYIRDSWHSSTRPLKADFYDPDCKWLGLKIVSTGRDDSYAYVHFVARFKLGSKASRLEENSRFVEENGRWYYLDGQIKEK